MNTLSKYYKETKTIREALASGIFAVSNNIIDIIDT